MKTTQSKKRPSFHGIKNPHVNPDGSVRFRYVDTEANRLNSKAAAKWSEKVTRNFVPVSTLHLSNLCEVFDCSTARG